MLSIQLRNVLEIFNIWTVEKIFKSNGEVRYVAWLIYMGICAILYFMTVIYIMGMTIRLQAMLRDCGHITGYKSDVFIFVAFVLFIIEHLLVNS